MPEQKAMQIVIPLKDGTEHVQDMIEGSDLVAINGNYKVVKTPNGFLGLKRTS